jgi:hydrogenase maturation protein HypF
MKDEYKDFFKYGDKEVDMTLKQLENRFNTAYTSSMGRVLDSISVLLKVSKSRGYEGECSMKLESAAKNAQDLINITLEKEVVDKRVVIDTSGLLLDVLELIRSDVPSCEIARASQKALAESMSDVAIITADTYNVDKIGATGGVFYNEYISEIVKKNVENEGYEFLQHEKTCCGDGSVSMGQCAVVGWQMDCEE